MGQGERFGERLRVGVGSSEAEGEVERLTRGEREEVDRNGIIPIAGWTGRL